MEHFWKKSILTAIGVALSAALAWMVIYPYVVIPRLGAPDYNSIQMLPLMLIGFVITLIVLGTTIRSAREFCVMAAVSGFLLQVGETVSAIAFPYAGQTPFTAPLEHWTIDLLFSIFFSALIMLIGLPFGWLFRRFQKPDLQ